MLELVRIGLMLDDYEYVYTCEEYPNGTFGWYWWCPGKNTSSKVHVHKSMEEAKCDMLHNMSAEMAKILHFYGNMKFTVQEKDHEDHQG